MNKMIEDMNKINTPLWEQALVLECVSRIPLGKFWDNQVLGGQFWRFYHHNTAGTAVRIRGNVFPMSPDMVYLIPPAVDTIRTSCIGHPVQLYIHFELPCLSGTGEKPITALKVTPLMKEMIHTLCASLEKDVFAQCPRTRLQALTLVSYAASFLSETEKVRDCGSAAVVRTCELFRLHLEQKWTLDELAERSGMAPTAFLRLFRESTGLPPYQYLLRLRYARAARLLESTELSVEEICESVGVSDRFHFSRVFRKVHGIPPAAYRKRHRMNERENV